MGRKGIIVLAVFLMVLGLGILLYPTVSSMINRQNGSYAIQEYRQQLDGMDTRQKEAELAEARAYNLQLQTAVSKPEDQDSSYYSILDFGNGIMGYILIPRIDVKLPIYHGVSTEVLEKGVGHLPSSSFPIEGEGNHAVLTGHTGLPSASLFTDLHKIQEGDRFQVLIGDSEITYEVDQIKVVLPSETEDLMAVAGEDYCTLVTCTPYGVNSHRLLVRGTRIELPPEEISIQVDNPVVEENKLSWFWLLPIPTVGMLILLLKRKRAK